MHAWFFGIIALVYFLPVFRLLLAFMLGLPRLGRHFVFSNWPIVLQKLTQAVAKFEYFFSPIRFVVTLILVAYTCYLYSRFWYIATHPYYFTHCVAVTIACVFLQFNQWYLKIRARLRMIEFVRVYPRVHPQDFFDLYARELAFGFGYLYAGSKPRKISSLEADFRLHNRSSVQRLAVFLSFWDSVQCVKMCFAALQNIGPKYMFENADAIAALAGKRILQYCQASFKVLGSEKLKDLSGKCIFVFNHESVLDFMLAPFALSQIKVNGRPARARFFVAKDHFRDNFFIYSVLGFGKVVEALGMIFLNRKQSKESQQSMKEAALTLVENEIDLAIYPQGTRANAVYDRAGKRRGAGYFTTISRSRLKQPLPHLKKGLAHLVHDILCVLEAKKMDVPLHLIFIGIDGAAKIIPKSIWTVETESEIEFRVGDVMTLEPHMLQQIYPEGMDSENANEQRKAFVAELTQHIDQRLVHVLQLPQKLSKRFFMDIKGQFRHFENDKLLQIERALQAAAAQNAPVYAILDCIYTLPVKDWNGYLAQFCQLLLMKPENDRFVDLLTQISEDMLK